MQLLWLLLTAHAAGASNFAAVQRLLRSDTATQQALMLQRVPFLVEREVGGGCALPALQVLGCETAGGFGALGGVYVGVAPSVRDVVFGETAKLGEFLRRPRGGLYFQALMNVSAAALLDRHCAPPAALDDGALMRCLGPRDHAKLLASYGWRALFVGPGAAAVPTGMPLHTDMLLTHTWSAQAAGEKSYRFCPPDAISTAALRTMVAADGVTLNHSLFGAVSALVHSSSCLSARARRGELVYWPSEWWHESRNTGAAPSISYSGMHVDDGIKFGFGRDIMAAMEAGDMDRQLIRSFLRCLRLDEAAEEEELR
jgi:hypothetical protein